MNFVRVLESRLICCVSQASLVFEGEKLRIQGADEASFIKLAASAHDLFSSRSDLTQSIFWCECIL